jgi:hypothetical protein
MVEAKWGVFLFLIFSNETIDKQPIQCIIGTERGHKMKSPKMNEALDKIARNMFGRERHGDVCVTCGGQVGEFRNDLSRKEYTISGMCQECQDSVFGVDGDE